MPSSREIERALGAELLEALRHHAQTSTEWMARLAGQLVNDVILVWSGTIGGDGWLTWSWHVAAGSVRVVLPEGGRVIVSSAGPAPEPPAGGLGVWAVGRPGTGYASETVPLASRQMTVYGEAGTRVQVQVYTAPVRPCSCGVTTYEPAV